MFLLLTQMWQIQPKIDLPQWIIPTLRRHSPAIDGRYVAQLLLSRGINTPEQLVGFLNPNFYQPASPFEFGDEMKWAVERLCQARDRHEKVTIWGDFDADGITSTAVLWEGLGQFLGNLSSIIPNRLTESHGLNKTGIETLVQQGCQLIVTCDTGSTNLAEIEYANHLGIDIIVTDHHTLPEERPAVVAIINPRYLSSDHPLYHLSGVAVAYKLVEALYQTLPNIPQKPLENLLDLVAIGLIADLVQLTGDGRYLAQRGIERLQQQLKNTTRPGVAKLLNLCQRNGDRPTDISFGLGPRINAVSRIYGDAKFCVELLTSRDEKRCNQLAFETELANTRRKAIQRDVMEDVTKKLSKLDLSTTHVIVLSDPQWPVGVLGLVAGQIAQTYGRPTILLCTEIPAHENDPIFARGSARSVNQIDLYELVKSQAHLLDRFGGHPFAAGLSLRVENLSLFTEGINRELAQQMPIPSNGFLASEVQVDLVCSVAELGYDLFQELKLLEPCGMGNPIPKILLQNCWFVNPWHSNEQDLRGNKIKSIKTTFEIWDDSCQKGFPGVWWGHYKDELPEQRCDAVVELDFNAYKKQYEVRLLEVLALEAEESQQLLEKPALEILDWRNLDKSQWQLEAEETPLIIQDCPMGWEDFQAWFRRAVSQCKKLAIAYSNLQPQSPLEVWQEFVGIAKYLSRTHQPVTRQTLRKKLNIGDLALKQGFEALKTLGFCIEYKQPNFYITQSTDQQFKTENLSSRLDSHLNRMPVESSYSAVNQAASIQNFLSTLQEEQFRQDYFCQVALSTIQSMATQTLIKKPDHALEF